MSQELEGTLTNSANLVGTFGSTGSGTSNYNDLANKPSINSVELVGNKTGNQLGLVSDTDLATVATTGNYNDLLHKPTIPAAQVNSDWNAISGVARILNKPTIPTKTSDLTNDSGFITSSGLATVATTGDYDDLTNKPTIPAAQVNSDWNADSGVAEILNKPTLSNVATSGSYNDLTDKPTLSGTAIINDPNVDPDETISQKITAVEGEIITTSDSITPSFVHANITTNGMFFQKFGDILYFSGYFSGSNIPRYQALFTLSGLSCATTFVPLVSVNNGYGYMEVYTSGGNINFRISNLPIDVSTNTVFSGCVKLV